MLFAIITVPWERQKTLMYFFMSQLSLLFFLYEFYLGISARVLLNLLNRKILPILERDYSNKKREINFETFDKKLVARHMSMCTDLAHKFLEYVSNVVDCIAFEHVSTTNKKGICYSPPDLDINNK